MKLKNLLFVFCLALLAGCQKDPDTEKVLRHGIPIGSKE